MSRRALLLMLSGSGYNIPFSLRFNDDDTAYLARTPSVTGTRETWTFSTWAKRGNIGTSGALFSAGDTGGDTTVLNIIFRSDDKIGVGSNITNFRITTPVYRDPSAWYHIVVAVDTTQGTANDRVKVYVNGAQVTAFDTINNPAASALTGVNRQVPHNIGRRSFTTDVYFDGYQAETFLIDGQQLTPDSFGQTDPVTGEWIAKKYTGTFGTNGFYLDYANSASLGTDVSGNGNNYTPSGLTAADQFTDTPTLNEAVMNSVEALTIPTNAVYEDGNRKVFPNSAVASTTAYFNTSFAVDSGKWYWEVKVLNLGDTNNTYVGMTADSLTAYRAQGDRWNGSTWVSYGASYTVNDVIGIAYNADTGAIEFFKNGTTQGSVSAGLSGLAHGRVRATSSGTLATLSIITEEANFTYTLPTGYKALSARNLSVPSVKNPRKYHSPLLYTGDGATTHAITGMGFQPDFVWIKNRDAANSHQIFDSSRGATLRLNSDTTNAEATVTNGLKSFDADGFTVGNLAAVNTNTNKYVGWGLKKLSGFFDIQTYTGDGVAGRTVAHNLGVTPELVLIKDLSAVSNWVVGHKELNGGTSPWNYITILNLTNAEAASANFNNTAPTSSVVTLGSLAGTNANGDNYVMYLFASKEGLSRVGSYVGNGNADGRFVYTGFKPAFVLIKRRNNVGSWTLLDASRDPYNEMGNYLFADSSAAEATVSTLKADFLSNGFKLRGVNSTVNGSADTYIYLAIAESPFKYARAH